MNLYYSPGTCSLSPHIVLRELGVTFNLVKVDIRAKQSPEGDFREINPKGYVPVLKLDSGEILTENAVIIQYLADQNAGKDLFPKFGSMERYHAMEWLNFVSTEFHKGIGAFFLPGITEDVKKIMIEKLNGRLKYFDEHMQNNQFILGPKYSIIDGYAFTVLRWTSFHKIDVSGFKGILAFMERVNARPAVTAALEAEGFKKH